MYKAVITPLRRFDFYRDGKQCDVRNFLSECQAYIYHRLDVAALDGKPLYLVKTREQGYLAVKVVLSSDQGSKKAWVDC